MNSYTIENNVVIKKTLPPCGIVCSNPQRLQRLIDKQLLSSCSVHTDSWGIVIYTGHHKKKPIFISTVPMGSGGSGFAFFEMYAAGAEYIVRQGSNDRHVTEKNLEDIIIVDEADNLYGLMHDNLISPEKLGSSIYASPLLVKTLKNTAKERNIHTKTMICHNVEDYHAYNNPHLLGDKEKELISFIKQLENKNASKKDCWDMESTALFLRATQWNKHAATVLQCIPKHKGEKGPYSNAYANKVKSMEIVFVTLILEALSKIN